jgi:catechol 2,3-dioxygenase-like lactoylglutathione lyase family enzyme
MEPIVDHIEITVKDMGVAVPFYDKLMPLLGFDIKSKNSAVMEDHEFHVVEYLHPRLGFAINSPRSAFTGETINRRRPGALHHIAFKVESRSEVDKLHSDLKQNRSHDRESTTGVSGVYASRLLRSLLQGSGGYQVRDRVL